MTEIIELNCYCTNCEHKEISKTHGIIDLASVICPICKQPMKISVKSRYEE